MKSRILRNDVVEIISGNDSKKKERVLQVMPDSGRIVVEHVNFVTKHVRKSRDNPNGARLQKEASMMAAMRHPNVVMYLGVCADPPLVAARISQSPAGLVAKREPEAGGVPACAGSAWGIPAARAHPTAGPTAARPRTTARMSIRREPGRRTYPSARSGLDQVDSPALYRAR